MNDNLNAPEDEKFSEDPEENLRMENEFLQMKLSAETGAVFGGERSDLPPEIMNEWLKNVAAFEKNYVEGKDQSVREILGNPVFRKESLLDDASLDSEYERLMNELEEHGIHIDFARERDKRFKYRFITEELFDHETSLIQVKRMFTCFSYEEFHPDHALEIEGKTRDFLNAFLERRVRESCDSLLAEDHVLPEGRTISREQLYKIFDSMYEAMPEFKNASFVIDKIDFELNGEKEDITGMGYSEGTIIYEPIFKDGKRGRFEGPFKIYFGMQWDWWTIYFFYLIGFNMLPEKDTTSE